MATGTKENITQVEKNIEESSILEGILKKYWEQEKGA